MPGLMIESDGATLFVTEKCNSNCIMCPMSLASRKRGLSIPQSEWSGLVDQIPSNIMHITITGGEPFLEYRNLLPAMEKINERFPDAEILILTNGRALSIQRIFDQLAPLITERYLFAVPIHASCEELHDKITQAPGSFRQSVKAIRKLSGYGARIEIRIVGHQKNISDISRIFYMLSGMDVRFEVVNLVAMEMMGCAASNRNSLWIDYDMLAQSAEKGIYYALMHGIDVGLYNFPLCMLPEKLWPLAKLSITPSKVRFYEQCRECREYNACGGLFYSTFGLNLCHVKPIRREDD